MRPGRGLGETGNAVVREVELRARGPGNSHTRAQKESWGRQTNAWLVLQIPDGTPNQPIQVHSLAARTTWIMGWLTPPPLVKSVQTGGGDGGGVSRLERG